MELNYFLAILLLLHLRLARSNESIQNYLKDRMQFVNEKLHKRHVPGKSALNTIDFADPKTVSLHNKSSVHTFSIGDSDYVLVDRELYGFESSETRDVLTMLFSFPENQEKIECVQAIDYDDISYLFVSFETGTSHIYRFANSTLQSQEKPIQTITTSYKISNAHFFTKHDGLYLATSTKDKLAMPPVIIYKWLESHFDEIDKVYLEDVMDLDSFSHGDSEIIIMLRNNNRNSLVYEFESRMLSKVQILDEASTPTSMITFLADNKTYLIINDNITSNVLYVWKEIEFVPIEKFDYGKSSEQVFSTRFRNIPLIISSLGNELHVSTVMFDRIQYLKFHQFASNYSQILKMEVLEYDNNDNVLHFIGLTDNNELHFVILPFQFENFIIENYINEVNDLSECMKSLDGILEDLTSSAEQYQQSRFVVEEDALSADHRVQEAFMASSEKMMQLELSPEMEEGLLCVQEILPLLEDHSKRLLPKFANVRNQENIINGKVIINGSLSALNLRTDFADVNILNGIDWSPNDWLSYSKDQIITGPYHISSLQGDSLTALETPALKDLLRLDEPSVIFNNLEVRNLKVNNTITPEINDIVTGDVYLKGNTKNAQGEKIFTNVKVKDINMKLLNKEDPSKAFNSKGLSYEFNAGVQVMNVDVENINGINWRNFTGSVFKIGSDQTIRGNISIANLKTQHLQPKLMAGFKATNLLTTSTPQTVKSQMHFKHIEVNNVQANEINGLNFENDIAVFKENQTTTISGPVSVKNVIVENAFSVNCTMEEFIDRYVVGSRSRDYLQIYNDKVKIKGTLHLENVDLLQSAKLFINGNEFNGENFNDYWLKTTNQEIPVHFDAQKGISTPHLNANLLNDIPIGDYMVNSNADSSPKRTAYVFENVTIIGNVIVNKSNHHYPDLVRLDRDAVKLEGSYVLRGSKKFVGNIEITNLKTDIIDDISSIDLLTRFSNNIDGNVTFTEIVAKSASANKLIANQINGIDLQELQSRTVFIDEENFLQNINLNDASVVNLFAEKINNKLFDEYMNELEKIHEQTTLKKFEIKGNATAGNITGLKLINNVNIPLLMDAISTQANDPIKSIVTFDGSIRVKELSVTYINGINIKKLLNRLYYRLWSQNVTASHSFQVINAPNIITPFINAVNTLNLIDITEEEPQLLKLDQQLVLINNKFKQFNVDSNFIDCDFNGIVKSLHDVPKRAWKAVQVNSAQSSEDSGPIYSLLNHAITTKKNAFVTAPVTLNNVLAVNVSNRRINGIDLEEIVNDAVTFHSPSQLITGTKEFNKLSAYKAVIYGDAEVALINDFNLLDLNASIINRQEVYDGMVIKGRKTMFGGLQTNSFQTPVALDIKTESLVSSNNPMPVPKCTFNDLTITNDLHVGFTNNVNFTHFLKNRLLLKSGADQVSDAKYFFGDVLLDGKSTVESMNGIPMEDFVFDEGSQVITAPKIITHDLDIYNEAFVDTINGIYFNDIYEDTLMSNEPASFTNDIVIRSPSEIRGQLRTKNINGIPVDLVNEYIHSENLKIRAAVAQEVITDIASSVSRNIESIKELPEQYMYLTRSDTVQLEIENSIGAKIVKGKGGVIAHIFTNENGDQCGLPSHCTCVGQHSVQITDEYAVNKIENKYAQRVFTYENSNLKIYVITTTVSKSDICSTNNTKIEEYTSITWTIPRTPNSTRKTGSFMDPITGYVSDVEFFEFDGNVFIVLAKHYDPSTKSHFVDSLVFRLSKDYGQVEQIQKIKTNAATNLHIFQNSHGVNLIISGNRRLYQPITTDIYSLNPHDKLFSLMRSIPSATECLSATSLVLDTDSLIILAYDNSSMEILKYNEVYENYYIHETLLHNEPIISVAMFFIGGVGKSDAYLTAVTDKNSFYVFSYNYLLGWKKETNSYIEGLNALVPIYLNPNAQFLFASSRTLSSLLTIVKQGV